MGEPDAEALDPAPGRPEATGRATSRLRRLLRRRWLVAVLIVLGVAVALRAMMPLVLRQVVEARLGRALSAEVDVGGVDLGLMRAEFTAHDIVVRPRAASSASRVHARAVHVRWSWRELLRGPLRLTVELSGVEATIDLQAPWTPAGPGPRAAAGLGPLRELSLRDGAVAVVPGPGQAPLVAFEGLAAGIVDDGPRADDDSMSTWFSASGELAGGGRVEMRGALSPAAPLESWTARFDGHRLALPAFNPLFVRLLELDAERGWLSFTGELTASRGRIRGQLVPRFEDVRLLGRGEARVRHPMAEALFGAMLAGADVPIEVDRRAKPVGDVALDAVFERDAADLLTRVVRRGYERRLGTLVGYDASIGGAELDLPAGSISFRDIVLVRSGGAVSDPFLQVGRLDVTIDRSAVDADTPTFKSVALHRPRLLFVAGPSEAASQLTLDPDWRDKVSAMPYPTDRLTIDDGSVEYRDDTAAPPTRVFVTAIALRAENLAGARPDSRGRSATISATGRVMDESRLRVEVALAPGEALDADVELGLDPLPLVRINDLVRDRFGVDFSRGTLGLTAEFAVRAGRVDGTLTPDLERVDVLGADERDVAHPLREWLVGRRLRALDGVPLALRFDTGQDALGALSDALSSAVRQAR